MTIHAFCRRLLAIAPARRRPRSARSASSTRPRPARLRDRAFREALDALLAAGDEPRSPAPRPRIEPWRLTAMTLGAHERLRSQGMADPRLPEVGDPVHSPKAGEEPRELTPAEVEAAIERAGGARAPPRGLRTRRYEELKEERSALDFADLELRALELLRSSPALGRGLARALRRT